MYKIFALITIALFSSTLLLSQTEDICPYQMTWQNCYGTEYDDWDQTICEAINGGYIIAYSVHVDEGDSLPGGFGDDDVVVQKTDEVGNVEWTKIYGGSSSEILGGGNIISDSKGYYYLSGVTWSDDHCIQSINHGLGDRWILKIDTSGNFIWGNCYGGNDNDYPSHLTLLSDGNIVSVGASSSDDGDVGINYGYLDDWLLIISPDGEILENKVLGNMGHNNVFDIVETRDGGFFMASKGYAGGMVSAPGHHGDRDVWAVKMDRHFNIEWQKVYGGTYEDSGARGLLELDNGYAFLAGTNSNDGDVTGLIGTPGSDQTYNIWFVRIDSIGNLLWQKCFGSGSLDAPTDLSSTEDGGFMIFGEKRSSNCGNPYALYDIWIIKTDSEGNKLWDKIYGGSGIEYCGGVVKKGEDNWVIVGPNDNGVYDCDVNCNHYGLSDTWLFNLKDCSLYQPLQPSQPTGPSHACSASGEPARYTVPPFANQTHAWHLEPAEAGTLTTHGDTLTVIWETTFEGTATLTARGVNDCGESGWSAPFYTEVETCAGIATNPLSGLRLWPNPATGTFNLQLPAGATLPAALALSDLLGRVVLRQTLTETLSKIDCSRLVEGVYFWRVELDYTSVSGKLIVRGER